MAYLQSYRGDYRAGYGMRGDPGIFGAIARGVKSVASGIIRSVVPPPVRAISELIMPGQARPGGQPLAAPQNGGSREARKRAAAGLPPKRRRMNPGNAKALRRAIRRQESFVKLARKALKGTKYTISTRGASRPRRVHVTEHGPGSVTVR